MSEPSENSIEKRILNGCEFVKNNTNIDPKFADDIISDYLLYLVSIENFDTIPKEESVDWNNTKMCEKVLIIAQIKFPDKKYEMVDIERIFDAEQDNIQSIFNQRIENDALPPENIYTEYSVMWATYEFAKKYKDEYRYVPRYCKWYIIDDNKIWKPDDNNIISKKIIREMSNYLIEINIKIKSIVNRLITENDSGVISSLKNELKILKQSQNYFSGPNIMLDTKKNLQALLTLSEFNVDKNGINLKNGVFELNTGILRERENTDFHTFVCDFEYDKETQCPVWMDIVKTLQPDERIQHYLQKYAGYCLSTSIMEEIFMLFIGNGDNGKSTFLRGMGLILGQYASVAAPEAFSKSYLDNNADVRRAGFEGKRFAYCDERSKYTKLNTDFVKQMTGKTVSARHMRGEPYQYENTCKMLLSSNYPPILTETGDAVKRRLRIVPWNIKVADTHLIQYKTNLEDILLRERSGIFNWMVEGYKMWINEGLELPEENEKFQAEYLSLNEPTGEFIDEGVIFAAEQCTLSEVIMMFELRSECYRKYAKRESLKGNSHPLRKREFYEDFLQSLQKRDKRVKLVKHNKGWGYIGISIPEIADACGKNVR